MATRGKKKKNPQKSDKKESLQLSLALPGKLKPKMSLRTKPPSLRAKRSKQSEEIASSPSAPRNDKNAIARETVGIAEKLAKKQQAISVSEFFTKNRHLLGFDNPRKALLTAVKEAVDNSLDACEEARILPEIAVKIEPVKDQKDRFLITVTDNGPGIVKNQIPQIFGSLLYGSKFHSLKMSRGQQGIGISAAAMYGQITTGKPVKIISKTSSKKDACFFELRLDMKRNQPVVLKNEQMEWKLAHGTEVEFEIEGKYQKGRQSVDEYIRQTMIANPHCAMTYCAPDGEKLVYTRETAHLPPEPKEIKPHPYGVELGIFLRMLHGTTARNVKTFLQNDFSRISPKIAGAILKLAGVSHSQRPADIAAGNAEGIYRAIEQVKIMNPATDCLAPIGEASILKGLEREVKADFYSAISRPPSVYCGNPFIIEVGLAWGG